MNILVHDSFSLVHEILKKYNEIWNKINSLFKKEFDSKPVYSDKYIKTKICFYNKNFYGDKIPVESKHYTCFSVIL